MAVFARDENNFVIPALATVYTPEIELITIRKISYHVRTVGSGVAGGSLILQASNLKNPSADDDWVEVSGSSYVIPGGIPPSTPDNHLIIDDQAIYRWIRAKITNDDGTDPLTVDLFFNGKGA